MPARLVTSPGPAPVATAAMADARPSRPRPGHGRADLAAGVVLVALGVALPMLVAAWLHALTIPRNDDWAYRLDLWALVRTGHLHFVGWGSMSLVGQLALAAPLALVAGHQAWVPGAAVALTACAGLVLAYRLAAAVVGRRGALAAAGLTLCAPGFLLNTSSFLTDVPAFAGQMACLAAGACALARSGRPRWTWLGLSLLGGLWAFSIREFSIAAPLAVLACAAARDRARARRAGYGALLAALLAACAGLYLWGRGLPGVQGTSFGVPGTAALRAIASAYFCTCLAVAPLLPGLARRTVALVARQPSGGGRLSAHASLLAHTWRGPAGRARTQAGVAAALGAAGVTATGLWLLAGPARTLLPGNYLTRQGALAGDVLNGTRPALFPVAVWDGLEVVALAGGAVLAACIAAYAATPAGTHALQVPPRGAPGRRLAAALAGPKGLVGTFTAMSALVLAGYGLVARGALWDRYTWPVVFGAAVLALPAHEAGNGSWPARASAVAPGGNAATAHAFAERQRPRALAASRLAAAALATLLAAQAVVTTLNADAFDGARWRAGLAAAAAGLPASTVDAGFEWVGTHARAGVVPHRTVAGVPGYYSWYDQMVPGFRECAVVTASPSTNPGLVLIGTTSYDELGFAGPEKLFTYAVTSTPGCPVVGDLRASPPP